MMEDMRIMGRRVGLGSTLSERRFWVRRMTMRYYSSSKKRRMKTFNNTNVQGLRLSPRPEGSRRSKNEVYYRMLSLTTPTAAPFSIPKRGNTDTVSHSAVTAVYTPISTSGGWGWQKLLSGVSKGRLGVGCLRAICRTLGGRFRTCSAHCG